MIQLQKADIDTTLYFYNPNIHPEKEYLLRKEENIRFADEINMPFIDADYDVHHWFSRTQGYDHSPERGQRCSMCFDMRFEKTAQYAFEHGFDVISSTLGISRWKDMEQINRCGEQATADYPEILYWTFNWRKQGGSARMIEISKEQNFYQQQYCGCVYSLRDTNRWRQKNQRAKIDIGSTFYGIEVAGDDH